MSRTGWTFGGEQVPGERTGYPRASTHPGFEVPLQDELLVGQDHHIPGNAELRRSSSAGRKPGSGWKGAAEDGCPELLHQLLMERCVGTALQTDLGKHAGGSEAEGTGASHWYLTRS